MKLKYIYSFLFCCFGIFITTAQVPNYHSENLEVVADLGEYQAIGLSVSSDNRIFVSFPKRGGAYKNGLVEIIDGKQIPYPNKTWNKNKSGKKSFFSIQDLYVDKDDFLWILDSKPAPSGSIFQEKGEEKEGQFKLLKIDLKTDEVVKVYTFEDLDKTKTALNDVRIDTEKQLAYFSDPGLAAIVVLDLKTEKSRVLLSNTKVTLSEPDVVLSYEGNEMRNADGNPFQSHINGIALTHDNAYFYFKPINGYALHRIKTKYLADENITEQELLNKVETIGNTVITHGMVADENNNIYLTSSIDYSVKYVDEAGVLHTLVQDKRLLWPDSLGVGSDGYLYFTCAQINMEETWNDGKDKIEYPYQVYRIKLPK